MKLIFWLFVSTFFFSAFLFCDDESVAKVTSINGIVLFKNNDDYFWEEAKPTTKFSNADEIKTTTGSYIELTFPEGHTIRMDQNSIMVIHSNASKKHNKAIMQMLRVSVGKIWVNLVNGTNEDDQIVVATPYISISKKNTLFSLSAPYGKVSAYNGVVEVNNENQRILIDAGSEAEVNQSGSIGKTLPLSEKSIQAFASFIKSTSLPRAQMDKILTTLKAKRQQRLAPKDEEDIDSDTKQSDDDSIPDKKSFIQTIKDIFKH